MDNNKLEKKYGLWTAICLVVGVVIGSGVFFKAQDILNYTDGNIIFGILAWALGGIVMVICAFNFANLATKHVKMNGIMDYAEATVGKKYAYMMGWFLSTMYYPAMTSVLAWVSARYTLVLFNPNADITSGLCMALGAFYMCAVYVMNSLAPRLAGKFQVSSTVIKLIPLGIMIIVGAIVGIANGNTTEAFSSSLHGAGSGADSTSILSGIAAASFAFEGWICATSINAELRDAKKNLPIALVVGTSLIVVIYILYFIGLTGGASVEVLRTHGAPAAFRNLFGNIGGTILNAFIVVSCLGTLNGLMLANTRSVYAVAVRGTGPAPETFAQVDAKTNVPSNSSAMSLLFCAFWFFYFYASNLTAPVFGPFSFDSSELPIITIYAMYIPIYVVFMIKEGKQNIFKNIVMPVLGIAASAFMVFVAVYAHGIKPYEAAAENGEFSFPVLFYLIVFAAIMIVGALLYKSKSKKE